MARIVQLPPTVVARIAAGEVIERPASVVKELIENSLDAAATRIAVEVAGGGTESIVVVDDGGGIEPDDLPLAFATHATSKLADADDLFRVGTLGFRGEGLASVAAVARVLVQSRPRGGECGAELRCDGGNLGGVRPWNGAPGTRVEVRHLFFNTPVRRKFLRGPGTEMGHVAEIFTRLALAHLGVAFTLRHNGRPVHDVKPGTGLLDRIALFFGDELRRQLHPVEGEQSGLTLGGYVAAPSEERGGPGMQYLFVNGRCVRDRLVSQALQEAYRGLLMTARHPVSFLFLEVPPDAVDVNVHPTKAEVRFRRPEKVVDLIVAAVRGRLQATDLTAPLRTPLPAAAPPPAKAQAELPMPPAPRPQAAAARVVSPPPAPQPARRPAAQPPREPERVKAVQMHDLYLLVEVPEGILVIDQHALHERVLFEQLKARLAAGRPEVQKLLIPETVNLAPAQAAGLLEHREALGELGLDVSDFGGGTVLLSGVPALLARRSPRGVLQAVVDHLMQGERPPTREALLNDLLALLACHAAVRAGDRLSGDEVQALVAQRHLAQDAHHCPHGRPSALLFTRHELARQFRRVG